MSSSPPEHNHDDLPAALPGAEAEAADAESPFGPELDNTAQVLKQHGRRGANWFYWVAGLSLVNSIILLAGGQIHFVIGLGITEAADEIAAAVAQEHPNVGPAVKAFVFGFDLFVALVVGGLGWLATKRYQVVFAIGMGLYLLDGLLCLLGQDLMSAGFHAFALFCMWSGFRAYRHLSKLEENLPDRHNDNADLVEEVQEPPPPIQETL